MTSCAFAASSVSNFQININGTVTVAKKRTCTFDVVGANEEANFSYVRNAIPNYFFLYDNVLNYSSAKTGSYSKYFQFVDYSISCSFQPSAIDAISLSYQVLGAATPGATRTTQSYLESIQKASAGFMVQSRTQGDWINFREVLTSAPSYIIAPSEFTSQPDGSYKATLNYAVAFVGANLASPTNDELANSALVSAGTYSRDLTLNVTYN